MDVAYSKHMDKKYTVLEERHPFRRPGFRCDDNIKIDPK
jgi:hypothetical protein